MAEHRGAARNHQPEPAINAFANPDHHRGRAQQFCLDAGRALALCGALVVATRPAFVPADNAALAFACFIGFLLWVLGACPCLLALTPLAPRAGAAAASTVLRCLSPLMN
ncbi:unnamed protein product [Urochloa decumbens]|uniref:Uncharacterized protein n=1 Tax=Urochloa decumbens TaxID=240449 RepID=A0ABC9ECW9_9POAL